MYSDEEILQMNLFSLKRLGLIKIHWDNQIDDWAKITIIPRKRLTVSRNGIFRVDDIQRKKVGA